MLEGKLSEKEECISRTAHVFSPSLCRWEPSARWLRVRGFNSEWPHSKGGSSAVRSVSGTESLKLSQICPSPDAVINFVVT